jgi:hypothetical protein
MGERTTEEQARINRGRNNYGKIPAVEDTAAPDDDNDVDLGVESGGMVHDSARSDASASGSSECSHGGHDRCICGMAGAREGEVSGTTTD